MGLDLFHERVLSNPFAKVFGRVLSVRRDSVRVSIPEARVGSLCSVQSEGGHVPMEIVSLDPAGHIAMPLNDLGSVRLGDSVFVDETTSAIPVGEGLLGEVIDSMCVSYENHTLRCEEKVSLYGMDLNPLEREPIREALDLGIRSINGCLTCGKGQRQGIFSGSGVGKSVLLGMMARFTSADIVVMGLIGERGREVREFIERELGPETRKKSVVVVETADKSAVRRVRGAFVATAVAEYFRKKGANVLLLVDSLTRFAMAQREIGMAAGEPPTSKGYTPSVFSLLSRLAERAGNWGPNGSITGLYTVLVEGDDLEDPIADAARAILDGHVVLSRKIANRGSFPAVDILSSVSRVMDQIVTAPHRNYARKLRELRTRYQENEDAIQYGMYIRGSDPGIDQAIEFETGIRQFLAQDRSDRATFAETITSLEALFGNEGEK